MENTSKSSKTIKKITRLSLFLALGIILNLVESMIPLPIAIPGVKLGLANTIGLVILYYYSPKEYISIGFLRVLIVGLLRTGLFSVAFILSLSGWFLSTLIVVILYYLKKFSIYGLSCISAVFHGVGQMIAVSIIYNTFGLVMYYPILMISGIITGLLTALLTSLVLLKVDHHIEHLFNS